LLGFDKGFQIIHGERGKRSLPSFLKKDEKSVNPDENGAEGAGADVAPVQGLKITYKRRDGGKILPLKFSKNPAQGPLLPREIVIPDKKILLHVSLPPFSNLQEKSGR
jgi:hypothetical protein